MNVCTCVHVCIYVFVYGNHEASLDSMYVTQAKDDYIFSVTHHSIATHVYAYTDS